MVWTKHRPLPAVSLWQPYASLIAYEAKWLETRTWAPARDLIGQRIAIAATATLPAECLELLRQSPDTDVLFETVRAAGHQIAWKERRRSRLGFGLEHDLPMGSVVCTVRLDAALPMIRWDHRDDSFRDGDHLLITEGGGLLLNRQSGDLNATDQAPYGDFAHGRWAWVLSDVDWFPPVKARGRMGVWPWRPPKDAGHEKG